MAAGSETEAEPPLSASICSPRMSGSNRYPVKEHMTELSSSVTRYVEKLSDEKNVLPKATVSRQ